MTVAQPGLANGLKDDDDDLLYADRRKHTTLDRAMGATLDALLELVRLYNLLVKELRVARTPPSKRRRIDAQLDSDDDDWPPA